MSLPISFTHNVSWFLEAIVRHEAAEALGAIGFSNSVDVLEKYLHDPNQAVSETCQLALRRIEWKQGQNGVADGDVRSPYNSVGI